MALLADCSLRQQIAQHRFKEGTIVVVWRCYFLSTPLVDPCRMTNVFISVSLVRIPSDRKAHCAKGPGAFCFNLIAYELDEELAVFIDQELILYVPASVLLRRFSDKSFYFFHLQPQVTDFRFAFSANVNICGLSAECFCWN